jgi:hypothetical protein
MFLGIQRAVRETDGREEDKENLTARC